MPKPGGGVLQLEDLNRGHNLSLVFWFHEKKMIAPAY